MAARKRSVRVGLETKGSGSERKAMYGSWLRRVRLRDSRRDAGRDRLRQPGGYVARTGDALRVALSPRLAIPLAWLFVVASVLDLGNRRCWGIREDLFVKATDVSWMILTFYVPALWVSVVLVAWRLWASRDQPVVA